MRFLLLTISAAIVLSGCDAPAPSAAGNSGGPLAPPGAPGASVVTITDTAADFDGKVVPFPATRAHLVAALGEPDRTLDKVNKILAWDQRGIYAYSRTDRDQIHDISFSFTMETWDFSPKKWFTGSIRIGNLTVTKDVSARELELAGFKKGELYYQKSLGSNVAIIEFGNQINNLGLSVP